MPACASWQTTRGSATPTPRSAASARAHNLYAALPRTTAAYLTLCNGRLTAQECYAPGHRQQGRAARQADGDLRADGRDDLRQLAARGAGRGSAVSTNGGVPALAGRPMRAISTRRLPKARTAPKARAPSARSAGRCGRCADHDRTVRRSHAVAGTSIRGCDRSVGSGRQSGWARRRVLAEVWLPGFGVAGKCRPHHRGGTAVLSWSRRSPVDPRHGDHRRAGGVGARRGARLHRRGRAVSSRMGGWLRRGQRRRPCKATATHRAVPRQFAETMRSQLHRHHQHIHRPDRVVQLVDDRDRPLHAWQRINHQPERRHRGERACPRAGPRPRLSHHHQLRQRSSARHSRLHARADRG